MLQLSPTLTVNAMTPEIVPLETVKVGDIISVTKDYRDTKMSLKGEVVRILSEGRKRVFFTGEGVELGSYVIGKATPRVILISREALEHSVLEVFA